MIFVSILVYAIVAMVVRKTATVDFGLCEDHSSARRQNIAITWVLGLLSIASAVVAVLLEDGTFALVGGALLLASAFFGTIKLRVVIPAKIDDHFVWLKGVGAGYLEEFPEWHGRA